MERAACLLIFAAVLFAASASEFPQSSLEVEMYELIPEKDSLFETCDELEMEQCCLRQEIYEKQRGAGSEAGPSTAASGPYSPCAQGYELGPHGLELLRLLAERPWLTVPERMDRAPRSNNLPVLEAGATEEDEPYDDSIRAESSKRSAVATALNAGRRRRQPEPALGVLNDVGTFFDSLRDNLESLALLSPEQRGQIFQDPPSVVHAPSSGGGGGGALGTGIRKLHALRPLRPTGNIRSYNRRSFVEADSIYPGANHHDPGLLWAGLGR